MFNHINYDHLLDISWLSETSIQNHITLYQGYVKNTNVAMSLMEKYRSDTEKIYEYSEIKRRFPWEMNGMRLHELYFENIAIKDATTDDNKSKLLESINANFENFEKWIAEFKNIATMRGIGWVILYQDIKTGKLFNGWIEQHDGGFLVGCVPLVVLDMFEHAFFTDFGTKKVDYIEAFVKSIDWNVVQNRMHPHK